MRGPAPVARARHHFHEFICSNPKRCWQSPINNSARRRKPILVGIRGYEFNFREGLSERARANLALAVTLMRRRIGYLLKVSR